jgi:hypothetical protein
MIELFADTERRSDGLSRRPAGLGQLSQPEGMGGELGQVLEVTVGFEEQQPALVRVEVDLDVPRRSPAESGRRSCGCRA